jgi:V/A-type H+-transporting ATPase subunit I
MFQPQAMSQMELVVPESDIVPVTEALADLGVFHQIDASYLRTRDGAPSAEYWQEQVVTFVALERRILDVMQVLGISEGELPPTEEVHAIESEVVRTALENLEGETHTRVRELEEESQKLERLQGYARQLEPLEGLDIHTEVLRSLRYTFVLLGTMPILNLERLQTSLARIPSVLLELQHDDHLAVVALFGSQQDSEILERAARSAYLNPINLPEAYRGTPAEIIGALNAGIERARQRIAESKAEIEKLHEMHIPQLRNLLWRVRASRILAEAIARFGKLHYTYLILGWVPTEQAGRLRHELERISDKVLIEVRELDRQEAAGEVPTALHNPPLLQGFQQLVTNYGAPRYNEIDPTPLLALTFPLIFGVMFGDVGHGLVLALLGLLLASGRVRSLRQMRGLGSLVAICGLTSMIFGFLYGSVFGMEHLLPPLWLRPLENITDILLMAVAMGVVLLNVGFACNLINAWLIRDWGRLLFSPSGLAGIVLYWSLIGLAASAFIKELPLSSSVFAITAIVGGVGMILSGPLGRLFQRERPLFEGGVGTDLVQALFELFETVISFMSNSLSYVRMGAFAVAHGGLSAVVFILAGLLSPSHGPAYWLVGALGNLVIVGFEGLIVGIQTMRVEYYEYFSKFFTGGGVNYRPLILSHEKRVTS